MKRNPVRDALDSGDAQALLRVTGEKVKNRHSADALLHMARSGAESIALDKRQYSHAWLADHGLPSKLPKADRPAIISRSVGIAVSSSVRYVKDSLTSVQENVVLSAYADGVQDPKVVGQLMKEAREREARGLELLPGERAKE